VPTTSTSGAYPSLPCVGFALSVRARAERSGAAHHDRRVDGVFRTDGRAATTCGTGRWRRWPPTCGRPPPASANPSSRCAVGSPTNTASPSQAWLHPERELSGSDHLVAFTTQPNATTCRSGRVRVGRSTTFCAARSVRRSRLVKAVDITPSFCSMGLTRFAGQPVFMFGIADASSDALDASELYEKRVGCRRSRRPLPVRQIGDPRMLWGKPHPVAQRQVSIARWQQHRRFDARLEKQIPTVQILREHRGVNTRVVHPGIPPARRNVGLSAPVLVADPRCRRNVISRHHEGARAFGR
jgi:hypothetical protein